MSVGGYGNNGIVTDGLVFSIDAYNTKSYVSGSTTVNDLTKNGNSGTLTNGVGYNGISWIFNNTNQYIDIGIPTILDISTTLTIETWIKLNNAPDVGGDTIIGRYSNLGGAVNQAWILYVSAANSTTLGPGGSNGPNVNEIGWLATSNGSLSGAIIGNGEALNVGDWYHIVATFDSPTDSLILYVNGELKRNLVRTGQTAGVLATGNRTIEFGASHYDNARYLDGEIPYVKFYNKTLTQSEVTQNYNALKWRFG